MITAIRQSIKSKFSRVEAVYSGRKTLIKNKKGGSLLEIMISVFVLLIGIMSCLMFFIQVKSTMQFSQDMVTATGHAETIMEEMRSRPSLANIVATDWQAWFNAQNIPPLPGQNINVTIEDLSDDPLDITTNINWTRNNRSGNVTLVTQLTKY